MKIGKPKPRGIAGVTPIRAPGDPKPEGYTQGRPSSYRPEYSRAIIEYFSSASSWRPHLDDRGGVKIVPESKLPTIGRFADGLGVSSMTLYRWADAYPEFGDAMKRANSLQMSHLMELVAAGVGGNGAMSLLRCVHGLVEPKAEPDAKDESPIQKVIVEVVGANLHKGD